MGLGTLFDVVSQNTADESCHATRILTRIYVFESSKRVAELPDMRMLIDLGIITSLYLAKHTTHCVS